MGIAEKFQNQTNPVPTLGNQLVATGMVLLASGFIKAANVLTASIHVEILHKILDWIFGLTVVGAGAISCVLLMAQLVHYSLNYLRFLFKSDRRESRNLIYAANRPPNVEQTVETNRAEAVAGKVQGTSDSGSAGRDSQEAAADSATTQLSTLESQLLLGKFAETQEAEVTSTLSAGSRDSP